MMIAITALFATPAFATDPDPVAQKTVASKAYVDTKQDKITTGLVEFDDLGVTATVPALVVTNSTGTALNGNTIGFLDLETYGDLNAGMEDLPDTLVPSIGLISAELQNMWNHMPSPWTALTWDSAETTSTNAYDITFVGDTGATANAWPAADKTKLINTAALAQGLALKQNKLPAQNTQLISGQQFAIGIPSSVIAPTADAGVVQQVALWDADGLDITAWDIDAYDDDAEIRRSIPTVGAVEVGLALKQDQIATGLVNATITQQEVELPALVSYDTTDGLTGDKIGILTQADVAQHNGGWNEFADDYSSHGMDNVVPTVKAVANALINLPSWAAFVWNSAKHPSAINAYSVTFGTATNNWPSANENQLVKGATFANALALKQNKLPQQTTTTNHVPKGAQTITLATTADGAPGTRYITAGGSVGLTTKSDAPAVIGYVNGTVGLATFSSGTFGSEHVVADSNHIKKALVSLELLKDVYSELNTKITNNALPTGTTGTVVTYNGTNATTGVQEFTETAVYDPTNAYDASTDAGKLATMASVKYVCAGYEPAAAGQPAHDGTHPGDEDYCWLWVLPN